MFQTEHVRKCTSSIVFLTMMATVACGSDDTCTGTCTTPDRGAPLPSFIDAQSRQVPLPAPECSESDVTEETPDIDVDDVKRLKQVVVYGSSLNFFAIVEIFAYHSDYNAGCRTVSMYFRCNGGPSVPEDKQKAINNFANDFNIFEESPNEDRIHDVNFEDGDFYYSGSSPDLKVSSRLEEFVELTMKEEREKIQASLDKHKKEGKRLLDFEASRTESRTTDSAIERLNDAKWNFYWAELRRKRDERTSCKCGDCVCHCNECCVSIWKWFWPCY